LIDPAEEILLFFRSLLPLLGEGDGPKSRSDLM
jgi:hypothetical protein